MGGCMPRPKMRRETVIITVSMERDLVLRLKRMARERGLSTSALIERILYEALGSKPVPQVPSDPLSPANPDPPVDPLTQVEWEEFESKLSSLENRTLKLEERLKALPAGGYGFKLGSGEQLQDLRKWLWDLRSDWDTLRSKYRELRSRIPADWDRKANEKLAQLKRRINSATKLLYAR